MLPSVRPRSRSGSSLLLAALGTALPAAGLIFVVVSRPQTLYVESDMAFGGAWLIFAAFLAPATVAAAFGLWASARHRRVDRVATHRCVGLPGPLPRIGDTGSGFDAVVPRVAEVGVISLQPPEKDHLAHA